MGNMSVKVPLVVNQTTTIQKTVVANLSSYAKSKPNGAKFLVVGLGNYSMAGTRHSVGMAVLNRFCNATGSSWVKDRHCQGDVARTTVYDNIELILLKPRLMMNINGICIAKAVDKFGIMPENLYLVHDDLDRNFGKFSIKKAGSAGGHNGVKSVISSLKSDVSKVYRKCQG
ncbi:probable peptidyl-tRNA hydrolase isoform X2 [Anneissia japonica]|uniref:probable peptidyl-tRNA hydrolase isoform X2 n=1 Tax=Anneissia japonica TaxID=1529436 RepID=UPI001425B1E6|nr:probable peptidyl-tRNA hydrolase isoform X2 [Anneissia japonica]